MYLFNYFTKLMGDISPFSDWRVFVGQQDSGSDTGLFLLGLHRDTAAGWTAGRTLRRQVCLRSGSVLHRFLLAAHAYCCPMESNCLYCCPGPYWSRWGRSRLPNMLLRQLLNELSKPNKGSIYFEGFDSCLWITIFWQGITIPSLNVMLSRWVPYSERSTIGAFVLAGKNCLHSYLVDLLVLVISLFFLII